MPENERDDGGEAVIPSPPTLTTVEVRRGGKAHALVPPLRLRVLEGPDAGATWTARAERAVIGSHESADLVLHDRTVSRFHCELSVEDGRVAVRDLESRNGTVIDGVSVMQAWLRSGSTLTLGHSRLRFELGDEPIEVALAESDRFGSLVGRSVAMRAVFARLEKAAASDATVLLEGETGTGKEAAAESIHEAGARKGKPFVVVDCGAIPPQLLESELFGHEKGSFTGATASREGAFEAAGGGTLFLDEIGELSPDLQPKLLRVLERREIKRIGNPRWQPVDVRVIAATNRNLRSEVNAGRFRSDLYYRLAVVVIRLPPLRERREDIQILVEHLLGASGAASLPEADLLRSDAVRAELAAHPWPGNVRELRNYVERCLALREPLPVDQQGASEPSPPPRPGIPAGTAPNDLKAARESWTREFERRFLEDLLARHGNNVSAAARAAGVDRKYFYRLLWRNGLR
jgi:DNA-binding NtrC family response regulator